MTDICQHCDRRIRRNAGDQWITNIGSTAICVGNLGGHEPVEYTTVPEIDNSDEAVAARRAMFKSFGW